MFRLTLKGCSGLLRILFGIQNCLNSESYIVLKVVPFTTAEEEGVLSS